MTQSPSVTGHLSTTARHRESDRESGHFRTTTHVRIRTPEAGPPGRRGPGRIFPLIVRQVVPHSRAIWKISLLESARRNLVLLASRRRPDRPRRGCADRAAGRAPPPAAGAEPSRLHPMGPRPMGPLADGTATSPPHNSGTVRRRPGKPAPMWDSAASALRIAGVMPESWRQAH